MQLGYNYIDGCYLDHKPDFQSFNPSNQEPLGLYPMTPVDQVYEAVEAASRAFVSWRSTSRIARAECFDKMVDFIKNNKERIARVISLETGKTLNESNAEVVESIHMVQYTSSMGKMPFGQIVASEISDKDSYVFRKPKGVIGVISPWNFPFAVPFWNLAPAILEGNTTVFKPSEEVPGVAQIIAEVFDSLPPGVFNLIHGDGTVGETLVKHPKVAHICFTGSAEVGRSIRRICADNWSKTSSLEMGSKSAVVVFDDANMDLAINACVTSAFKLSGQRCVSASRILVQYDKFYEFAERFVERARNLKIGDPIFDLDLKPHQVDMGPLINEKQMKSVMKCNEDTKRDTQVLLQGERINRRGWFLTPHVYSTEWQDYHFLKNEVFGPHVALIPFTDANDAVRIYNDTKFGLSLAVITKNMAIARFMRDNCDFGMGYHNLPSVGASSFNFFGGVKGSGIGGPSAAGSFKTLTDEVTWTANFNPDGFQMNQGLT